MDVKSDSQNKLVTFISNQLAATTDQLLIEMSGKPSFDPATHISK